MLNRPRRGFTLIEVLVVVSIVGLLLALLLPAIQGAREAARRLRCSNTFKQLGLAIASYDASHNSFPFAYNYQTNYSLHVALLPFMEAGATYNAMNLSVSAFRAEFEGINTTATAARGSMLVCPSDGVISNISQTNYAACTGDGRPGVAGNGIFGTISGPQSVVDGMSSTAAMSEFLVGPRLAVTALAADQDRLRVLYGLNGDLGPDNLAQFEVRCKSLDDVGVRTFEAKGEHWFIGGPSSTLYNHVLTINQPSCSNFVGSKSVLGAISATSLHPGGANCLYADGHVRFIRDTIDAEAWRAMGSMAGGEITSAGIN